MWLQVRLQAQTQKRATAAHLPAAAGLSSPGAAPQALQATTAYKGSVDAYRQILAKEGFLGGLYRGYAVSTVSPLILCTPATCFLGCDLCGGLCGEPAPLLHCPSCSSSASEGNVSVALALSVQLAGLRLQVISVRCVRGLPVWRSTILISVA